MDILNIVQWNAQSIISNRHSLTQFLYNNNIHIGIISETWLKPHHKFNVRGYSFERNDCGNKHNGVGILIRNDIHYNKINTVFDDSMQNICVRIDVNGKKLSVVSFYSPTNCCPAFDGRKLDSLIKSIPSPMIFAGDFNAHHTSWGCGSTSPRGRDVLDVIDSGDLCLLNDGQVTTVGTVSWRSNALDLSFVSSSLALSCEWSVYDDPMGSYHLPVIIKVVVNKNATNVLNDCLNNDKHLPIYPNYRLVDWQMYKKNVDSLLLDFDCESFSPQDAYSIFCKILKNSVEGSVAISSKKKNAQLNNNNSCSSNKKSFRKPSLPWWNRKCSEVVLNSKNAYIKFKHDPTEENFLEFKRLQALKKLTLRTEKRNSWVILCNSFDRHTPLSVIWKFTRKFNKTYIPSNNNDHSWVPDFLRKYTPELVVNEFKACENDNINPRNHYILEPFSITELKSAILSRRDTAFGLDGIPYKMFKNLSDKSLIVFQKILNLLWAKNEIPSSWKVDCLVPVLKPNKPSSDPNSYRPIALTSCVSKIFEQLLKQRFEFYIEQNGILPSNQFGFRRGRSARESICQLHLDINKSFIASQSLLSVFFDISSAFNCVNIEILCKELYSLALPKKFVCWIYNFLTEREVFVKHNGHLHGPRLSSVGVCQGGILSPLLFILYIRRLNIILGTGVKNLQFADDLVVYATATDLPQAVKSVDAALTKLHEYFSYLNLEVNPSKSKLLVFGKRGSSAPVVRYNNSPLLVCNEAKFLGVIFTHNLTWKSYINHIINRANKAFNILKSLASTYWGADPKIMLILYKSLVRSHFEYGFLCFATDKVLVETLNKIQNKCLRLITGAFRSTPIGALQIECQIPPLQIRFNYLKEKFILKIYSISNNSLFSYISNSNNRGHKPPYILQDLSRFLNFLNPLNIYCSNLPCFEGLFHSKYPEINIIIDSKLSNKQEVDEKLSEWNGFQFIFTDGSKSDSGVSFAMFEQSTNIGIGYGIDKHASIFTAEAVAILFALRHIKMKIQEFSNWLIISDSMSVLKNLQNNKINANTNYLIYTIKELWVELATMKVKVDFLWVPSHCGVVGNDKADYLARTIVNSVNNIEDVNSLYNIALPYSDVVALLNRRMYEQWGRHWYNCTQVENKGCWYAALDVQVNSLPWFAKSRDYLNRKFYTTMCRLRFGHCRLNFHLHRLNITDSPLCELCHLRVAQTINHIFFECSSFGIQRLVLIDELIEIYGSPDLVPRCIKELLKNVVSYPFLYKFVYSTISDL